MNQKKRISNLLAWVLLTSLFTAKSWANLDPEEIAEIRRHLNSFSKKSKSISIGIDFLKSSKELRQILFESRTRPDIQMTFGEYKVILQGVKPKPINPPSKEEFDQVMQGYQERQSRVDQIIERRKQEAASLASAVPSHEESKFFDRFIRNANKLEEFRKLRNDSHVVTANGSECSMTVNDLTHSFKEMISLRQAIRKGEAEFFSIRHDRKQQIATLAAAKRTQDIKNLKIFSDENKLTEGDLKKFDEAKPKDKWLASLKQVMAKLDPWFVTKDDLRSELEDKTPDSEEEDSRSEVSQREINRKDSERNKSNAQKSETEDQMDDEIAKESSRLVSSTSRGRMLSVSEPEISRSYSRLELNENSPRETEMSEVREESKLGNEKAEKTKEDKSEEKSHRSTRKKAPKAFDYSTRAEITQTRSAPEITDPVQIGKWSIQFSKNGHDGTSNLEIGDKKAENFQMILGELAQTGTLSSKWKNDNFSYFQADSSVGHVHLPGKDKIVVVWKKFKNDNRILILHVGKHPNKKDGYNRFLGIKESNPKLLPYSEIKQ